VDAAVVEKLCCHRWPLNIREVSNLAKRVMALHGHEKMLKRSHLVALMGDAGAAAKPDPAPAATAPPNPEPAGLTAAERDERQRIIEVLDRCAGNQTAAARMLNISRSTMVEKLKRYGIRRPQADRDA
jgi:DNA-binding NtrC family response regulator